MAKSLRSSARPVTSGAGSSVAMDAGTEDGCCLWEDEEEVEMEDDEEGVGLGSSDASR
jgi:hypothetical protein